MENKFIIYNKTTNLEDYEIVDYLKSVIVLSKDLKVEEWNAYDFNNGIQAEVMKNQQSKTILIKGTYKESEVIDEYKN